MQKHAQSKATGSIRIGELLESLGLLSEPELQEALLVSQETGLPVGRVLVMSGFLSDSLLTAVVEAQTMLREGQIDMLLAKAALIQVQKSDCSLKDALAKQGFKQSTTVSHMLGELLLDAGFILPEQLQIAFEQANATGLPIGRTLVLSGYIPDGLLTKAINAQVLLRDGKITRDQAIQSLRSAASRHMPIEVPLAEKGYYALPARQSLRLGELLIASGIISEQELLTSLELGLANNKPIGKVLVDLRFIDERVIAAALELQKRVVEQTIKLDDATRMLSSIHRDGLTLESVLAKQKILTDPSVVGTASKGSQAVNFSDFLELTQNLKKDILQQSLQTALANPQLLAKILENAGAVDKNLLNEALRSYQLYRQGRLPLEQACVVVDFCKRNQVSTDQALDALHWQQKDMEQTTKPKVSQKEKEIVDWAEDCKTAYAVFELGDYDDAEKQWVDLLKRAERLEIRDLRLPRAMEVLAKIYETQNKLEQALDLAGQGLKIKRLMLAPNHFETAASLNHLASLSYKLNDLKLSEDYSRRYLKMLEVLSGPNHPNVASALDNLGLTCHLQKRYEEAGQIYQRALMICTSSLGEAHPTTVRVLRKYAATLRALKRDSEADHFDSCAMAVISGSWKTLHQNEESLF